MVDKAKFEEAVSAAIEGPDVERIKVDRHEMNVRRAAVAPDRIEGRTVKGQLSRHLAFRDGDQVYYECKIVAGRHLTIEQVKMRIDGAWTVRPRTAFDTVELANRPDAAAQAMYDEASQLLDGSWQGEAQFLILNIVGRLAIREAQNR